MFVERLGSFTANTNFASAAEKELRFAFRGPSGRVSDANTVLPIWATGPFKPVRIRPIIGKAEQLSGM